MIVIVNIKELEWFKKMQSEGRTRSIKIHTYRTKRDDSEVELCLW